MDPDCVGVQFLPVSELDELYKRTMTVMDNCLKAPSKEEAEKYRNGELTDIFGLIQCHMKPRVQTQLIDLPSIYPVDLRVNFTHVYYSGEQFPTGTQWKLVYHLEAFKVFDSLVQQQDKEYQGKSGVAMKMGIVGDDFLLRIVAGTYLHFCQSKPENSQILDIHFYLIPSPSCRFAEMIYNEDSAYKTQVIDSMKYLLSIHPQFPDRYSQVPLTERSRKLARATDSLPISEISGRELPNPASCMSMIVDSFCTDAQCVMNVPITVCQCDDLQRRFCHSHVFFSQCVLSPWMEKQQTNGSKQFFNIAISYEAVGADGSTKRTVENKRVYSVVINRLISTSFKMELLIYAEDDSVCYIKYFIITVNCYHCFVVVAVCVCLNRKKEKLKNKCLFQVLIYLLVMHAEVCL